MDSNVLVEPKRGKSLQIFLIEKSFVREKHEYAL